jgi:peroxiredoxin
MLRLVLALAFSLLALPAFAQVNPKSHPGNSAPDVRVSHPGISSNSDRVAGSVQVGEHAPDFALPAAGGTAFRLRQTRGAWVALFFTNRREDLNYIAGLAVTLDSLHFTTVTVCNEKPQALVQWSAEVQTKMTVVSDDRGSISSVYGLWDVEGSATRPGLFLLDPTGTVRMAVLGRKIAAPSLKGIVQTAVEGL